jgi:hypothetical protein
MVQALEWGYRGSESAPFVAQGCGGLCPVRPHHEKLNQGVFWIMA